MYKLLFLVLIILASCSSNRSNSETLIIASQQGDCIGVVPQKCLWVKKDAAQNWEFFYTTIDGFDYEPGYEYTIEVEKENVENPPADASSIKYKLVKVVSKEQKQSEGLPQ